MQYVRSISGSVSKTWNSINPATLSGAIDVIVVEQADGTLACSPFHVRFGKFSLLRPFEKKVEFRVNKVKQDYSMKLGEGGEAFFVFETTDNIPPSLQTSPIVSPAGSPSDLGADSGLPASLPEPPYLDLSTDGKARDDPATSQDSYVRTLSRAARAQSDLGDFSPLSKSSDGSSNGDASTSWSAGDNFLPPKLERSASEELLPLSGKTLGTLDDAQTIKTSISTAAINAGEEIAPLGESHPNSPPPLSHNDAVARATHLSQKLSSSNIRSHVTDSGDLVLDMIGYKSGEEEVLRLEVIARKLLADELEGNYDIGSLIGPDKDGKIVIYHSEEAKEAANRKTSYQHLDQGVILANDAASDPGYHSGSDKSGKGSPTMKGGHQRAQSEQLTSPEPMPTSSSGDRNFAKTLRLTSDQLKQLNLKPGGTPMSFTVNKATCQAYLYYWSYDVPIVVSDVDGTITKSDALGHLYTMIGRDWTHPGVAKLYSDIVENGYNILYLTSRSVGQADTTRAYLNGVVQEGYRLPKGPVIMSPDRTLAALRREVYLRKPEVFKMACLRDLLDLFPGRTNPFYAGFGNRLTDALSYRSVNIPSSRIFTINSNAEVSLDLLSLNKYKITYVSMREIVDHFFPPVSMLVKEGGEEFTDFNYWRDSPQELDDFSATDSEESEAEEEDLEEKGDDLGESYLSRESIDQSNMDDSMLETIESSDRGDTGAILEGDDDIAADYLDEPPTGKLSPVTSNESTGDVAKRPTSSGALPIRSTTGAKA